MMTRSREWRPLSSAVACSKWFQPVVDTEEGEEGSNQLFVPSLLVVGSRQTGVASLGLPGCGLE